MKSIIDAPCGRLLGTQDNGVMLFRNIPYASAPIGDLRFAPPQVMAAWSGTRYAALAGFVPPQGKSRLAAITGGEVETPQSEDCLTLELTRAAGTGSSRPVLVWIHGGGFVGGSGSHPWYSAAALARRGDVAVVNLNFRQGVLGHLCLPGVSPGNLALLDIVMALRWVRLNIAAFGGDPDCVTVFGQSSGASAIAALLAMPAAEGGQRVSDTRAGKPTGNTIYRPAGQRLRADSCSTIGSLLKSTCCPGRIHPLLQSARTGCKRAGIRADH
ncbi:MAG: carboxylesterase/lipase family protein [Burkholderiales bacterium]|nr:carboxylesterase/lipase family protein [Burkholderiales bacterium]ODU68512.1 MAG: hypothetical protein ABT05_02740 [Lautropia sp. SCN 66-9]